jgi:hypothetical protein
MKEQEVTTLELRDRKKAHAIKCHALPNYYL